MKIAHISDLHIRNLRYRDEYSFAFDDLYSKIRAASPDLIINTGDTVHSKLSVSPELFDDVAKHMIAMAEIAPYYVVLGNHDLNLKNKKRVDAVSPIIRAIEGRTKNPVSLLSCGRTKWNDHIDFWNYDIREREYSFDVHPDRINIGLFHGSVNGCSTDAGFVIDDSDVEISLFQQMDYVLLGDIHKHQTFRNNTIAYPGSLIQQNYGEDLNKGFLLWNINTKTDHSVEFKSIECPGRFYTIQVPQSLNIDFIDVPIGSRVRAIVDGDIAPAGRWELEKKIRERFSPIEFICSDSTAARDRKVLSPTIGTIESLIDEWFVEHSVERDRIESIMKQMSIYERTLDERQSNAWRLNTFGWSDLMNYGPSNIIDMTKLVGLVGVFGPNGSGKSSIFDILLQGLFDKTSKDAPRNVDLINDNKQIGKVIVEFSSDERLCVVERAIERLHYGQRKSDIKQWGRTTLDFTINGESQNGTTRPETERAIRSIIGNFDDFVLTTFLTQNPNFGLPGGGDIINCKESDRRRIMCRFLNLDRYEEIASLAKDDLKSLATVSAKERDQITKELDAAISNRQSISLTIDLKRAEISSAEESLSEIRNQITNLRNSGFATLMKERDELRMKFPRIEIARSSEVEKLNEIVNELSILENQLSIHLNSRPPDQESSLADLNRQLSDVKIENEIKRVDLTHKQDSLVIGRRSLKTIDDIPCERKFPTCKFISDALSFVTKEPEILDAIKSLIEQRKSGETKIKAIQAQIDEKDKSISWIEQEKNLSASIKQKIIERDNASSSVATLTTDLEATKIRLADIESQLDSSSVTKLQNLHSEESKLLARISSTRSALEKLLIEIGGIEAKILSNTEILSDMTRMDDRSRTLELLIQLMGKNGLQYKILSRALPIINDQIAKMLAGIVKFSVFFDDDQENQTIGLYIRYSDYKSRPLALCGGAEKFLASIAIRVALLSVSTLPKTDMLIIDEGFGKLDVEHLESIQRMFEHLKKAFSTVFIISHVDFLKDVVDHTIDINSLGGYAHVEVT